MGRNDVGDVALDEWLQTERLRPYVQLDVFAVVPNHFHAILLLKEEGTARRAPTIERFGKPTTGSIPTIVRAFKSSVTVRVNKARKTPSAPVWQRNYFERIIRDEEELNRIREYILYKPILWDQDLENPLAGTARKM